MPKIKLELGDILELETGKGLAYIQCVEIPADKRNEIELIKVYYDLHEVRPTDLSDITAGEFFFIRFPLKSAKNKKIVNPIGNILLSSDFEPPLLFRTTNPFGEGWQIVNSKTWKRENVTNLTKEQIQLSPWGTMNDTLIKELLERKWTLEKWFEDNLFLK
jgi:hypothetical protein